MLTYDELVAKYGTEKQQKAAGPSKEDILYQRYKAAKQERVPEASGGTLNPTIRSEMHRTAATYQNAQAQAKQRIRDLEWSVPKGVLPSADINTEIYGKAKYGGTANPTISAADFSTRYNRLTDREHTVYSYYKKKDAKTAKEYLQALENRYNQEEAAQRTAEAKKLAEDSLLGGLYARYMAGLSKPIATGYSIARGLQGRAIDPNHPSFSGEMIREGQTEGFLGDSTGIGRMAKEAALGAFDWVTQVATLNALGLKGGAANAGSSLLYGMDAFNGNVRDAAQRDANTSEALSYGAVGAAAETLAEKLGYDRLFEIGRLANPKGSKSRLAKEILLKGMGGEALEEGTTEAANLIADAAILGESSQLKQAYLTAIENGATDRQATLAALKSGLSQTAYAGAVGGLSGGMIAGGLAGLGYRSGSNPLGEENELPQIKKPGFSQRNAEKNAKQQAQQTQPQAAQKAAQQAAAIQPTQQPTMQQSQPQAAQTRSQALEDYGSKYYGEKGREAYFAQAQSRDNLDFTPAFDTYYRAGLVGLMEKEIKQTAYTAAAERSILRAAYMAGTEDRRTELRNAITSRNRYTGKKGVVLGEDVKATKEQLAIAGLYADIGGASIRLVDEISVGDGQGYANGMTQDGEITIALNAESFVGTLNHEMIHYIRRANPEGFDTLRELVFSLANESGIDMEKQMEQYRRDYETVYGEDAGMRDYLEEMVSDAFQKITADEKGMQEFLAALQKKDKTLIERIRAFLDAIAETLKGLFQDNTYTDFAEEISKDIKNVELLREAMAHAMTETGRMQEDGEVEIEVEDARYSLNKDFQREYDAWDGKKYITFHIGTTSAALKGIGLETKKIIWHSGKIKKIKEKHKGMTDEVIKQVPNILENPIIVMKSAQENTEGETSRITVFGEVEDAEGIPVLAVLELQPKNKNDMVLDFQVITSAYGKTNRIKNFIENAEVLYLDENKERTNTWLKGFGLQLPSSITKYGSVGTVSYEANNVKINGVRYRDMVDGTTGQGASKEQAGHTNATFSLKKSFSEQVDAVLDESSDFVHSHVYVTETPKVLTDLGLQKLPMLMTTKHIYTTAKASGKYKNANYHDLGADLLKQLPDAMQQPIAIMESASREDSVVLVLELQDKNNNPVIASVKIDGYGNYEEIEIDSNVITSVYGKSGFTAFMEKAAESGRVLYFDKEKSQLLNKTPGIQFPDNLTETDFSGNITRFRQKVKENRSAKDVADFDKEKSRLLAGNPGIQFPDDLTETDFSDNITRFRQKVKENRSTKDVADFDFDKEKSQTLTANPGIQFPDIHYGADFSRTAEPSIEPAYNHRSGMATRQNRMHSAVERSIAQDAEESNNKISPTFSLKKSFSEQMDAVLAIKDSAITYDSLIEKPDMKVTVLSSQETEGKTRAEVIDLAKESVRRKNNPKNTNEMLYVHNNDVGKDILVGKNGIKHSMQRKWHTTAAVFSQLGDILENAIKINELTPREGVESAYILLGYAVDENASQYTTIFVVNEFKDGDAEAELIDVLYSANAKKIEPSANAAKARDIPAPSSLGSTINIAELIQNVNEVHSDVLPISVAEHFGNERKHTKLGDDVKFSLKKMDIEADIATNEDWKAAYEGLLREFEVTRDPLRDRESAKKVARKFLKSIDSSYDLDEFSDRFVRLCNYGAEMASDSDYKELLTACTLLAKDALQGSAKIDTELYNAYAELRKELRSNTLYIGEKTKAELDEMGTPYAALRKENLSRVTLSQKSGEQIDTKYAELAERYPELFKMDQSSSQGELLMDIIAVRDSLDPVVENPYFQDMESHATAAAYELLGMMNDVALEKRTFADKYEDRLSALREENKKKLKELREKSRNEKKLLREEYKARTEERLAQVKQKYEKRLDRKEYLRLRKLAEADIRTLAKWLREPTDKKHVPTKLKATIETMLAHIDTDKPNIKIALQDFIDMKGALMELYGDTMETYILQDDQTVNILDRFIQKYPEGANLDTMSAADMNHLRNLFAYAKRACMDANKLHTSERQKTVAAVAEDFIAAAEGKKDLRERGVIKRLNDFFGLEMLDANSFFKRIGGEVYTELYKGLRKGFDRKIDKWREAMEFINETVDPKTMREWTEEKPREFTIGGEKVFLTIPQIMSLQCLMKRKQGAQHIIGRRTATAAGITEIKGEGFRAEYIATDKAAGKEKPKVVVPTMQEVQSILDTLSEGQKQAASAIQAFLSETVSTWGNEVSEQLFGYKKFNEQNYFPIVSDKDFVHQSATSETEQSLLKMGMTRNTNRYANNPLIIQDIFKVYAKHVDQMTNYYAFAASESDFNKFRNYKTKREDGRLTSVKYQMEMKMGKGAMDYIKTLLNRIATSGGLSDDSSFVRMLVRNMKVASVGANLRVILQQPTAYFRAGNYLDIRYLLNAKVLGRAEKEIIYQYCPIALWKSWGNYEMDTGKTMYEQMIAPTLPERLKDFLMAGAGRADEWTWSRLWNACLLETQDKHKDEALSQEEIYTITGERMSEIVDESQVVDSVLHRSQIMRRRGIYTQMATSFMSEPIKTFNMASNALLEVVRDNTKENRRKFMRCYLSIVITGIATACAAGLADACRDDDDDDSFLEKWKRAVLGDFREAEKPQDYALAAMSSNIADNLNPLGMIPYLRDMWSMMQGYEIKRTDFDWLNDILNNIFRWKDFIAGESKYTLYSMLLNTSGVLSKAVGIPISSLERDIKGLCNMVVQQGIGTDEAKYEYKKLGLDVGSQKNTAYYVERMLKAKFSGNHALAKRIYNDMVAAGIDNDTLERKIASEEIKRIRTEQEASEAVAAYHAKNYGIYTDKMDALRDKGYSQKGIEDALSRMYKEAYGEEKAKTFEEISADFWSAEEKPEKEDFQSVIHALVDVKTEGKQGDATELFNYMVDAGLDNDSIRSGIDSRERERIKKGEWIDAGAEAYHNGDVDGFLAVVDKFQEQHFFTENIYEAIAARSEQLYGEEKPGDYEHIDDAYWQEDTDDTGADYGLLFNAWKSGGGNYGRIWEILEESGKKKSSIQNSMRSRLEKEYELAIKLGDAERAESAKKEYLRLGGKEKTLLGESK